MQGLIIKGIGGFYYVKVADGIIECKLRGKFRHDELVPVVGDNVEINVTDNKGVIDRVFKRSNLLLRPSIANVTQVFIIFSIKNPDPNRELLNKFLILCEVHKLRAVVCINKFDLIDGDYNNSDIIKSLNTTGYEILLLKAKENIGIDLLKNKIKDNLTVICGPSGVGKSTILNAIIGKEFMKTGELSEKLKRGKHTTRHCELVSVNKGFIVDTPGFTSLEIPNLSEYDFQNYFPEFREYKNNCRFNGCLHYKEPDCAVKEAVNEGIISEERYHFYVSNIENLLSRRYKKW